MSSLNLNLDFMHDEQTAPISFVRLTPEEELELTRDAIRLQEQIDEDLRILNRMCSAYENLLILKEHYEQYGSSPALEVLVGDIKEYLDISLEAEESSETSSNDSGDGKEEKGGFWGTLQKIWDWIAGLFRRIAEWLNVTEKIDESNRIGNDANLDSSSKHDIKVNEIVFQNGSIVDKSADLEKLSTDVKKCFTVIFATNEKSTKDNPQINSLVRIVSEDLNNLKPLVEIKVQTVSGSQIKELNGKALDVAKKIRNLITGLDTVLKAASSNKNKDKKIGKSTGQAIGIIKQAIDCLTKAKQGVTIIAKQTYPIAYPKAAKAKEEAEAKRKNEEAAAEEKKDKKTKEKKKPENTAQKQTDTSETDNFEAKTGA